MVVPDPVYVYTFVCVEIKTNTETERFVCSNTYRRYWCPGTVPIFFKICELTNLDFLSCLLPKKEKGRNG
jgi:hypothetical protein